jgi:drug/metabolite transporter (DMT)-like permease
MEVVLLALGANLSFSLGSQFFTHYSRKFSSAWMNTYKALVALILFTGTVLLTGGFHDIQLSTFSFFFVSGFLALGIGDIFLLNGFREIGPGRTMVLFGFHPLIVGILSFFIFGQEVPTQKLFAIVFMILCLITFSVESFKKNKSWDLKGITYALFGVVIDAIGVIITRYAFDLNTEITALEGNTYRCIGALVAYAFIRGFSPFQFRANFKSLNTKSKIMVTLGAMLGTYLSLALYLKAIQTGQLAIISSISITSVIFASTFESLWERKKPSVYLLTAFIFFFSGMYFILK